MGLALQKRGFEKLSSPCGCDNCSDFVSPIYNKRWGKEVGCTSKVPNLVIGRRLDASRYLAYIHRTPLCYKTVSHTKVPNSLSGQS